MTNVTQRQYPEWNLGPHGKRLDNQRYTRWFYSPCSLTSPRPNSTLDLATWLTHLNVYNDSTGPNAFVRVAGRNGTAADVCLRKGRLHPMIVRRLYATLGGTYTTADIADNYAAGQLPLDTRDVETDPTPQVDYPEWNLGPWDQFIKDWNDTARAIFPENYMQADNGTEMNAPSGEEFFWINTDTTGAHTIQTANWSGAASGDGDADVTINLAAGLWHRINAVSVAGPTGSHVVASF